MTQSATVKRSRRHVLHVIKGLGRGGAEKLLEHAQENVDSDRYRLSFAYFLRHKSDLASRLERLGADVTLVPARGPLGMARAVGRVARLIREQRVDLVHGHLPLSGVVARLAGRRAGVPVVYTEHSLQWRYHPLTRWANRMTWGLQRKVVAVSDAVARSIHQEIGESVEVEVVPNGVPSARLDPADPRVARIRSDHGIPPGAPLIGQVAVFRPGKRLDLWLQAAAEIRRHHPDAKFLLVGDGPERARLETLRTRLELEDAVFLTGLLKDVRPALSAMDLLMISSDFEGLPLVVLEAMSAGVPIVATHVGGMPEAILEGRTGLLCPPGEPHSLAEAVSRLLESPDDLATYGAAAARRADESFSAVAVQKRLEAIYGEVLER